VLSGTVIDERTGITVAHAVNGGENVMKFRPENSEEMQQVIGQCLQTFRYVQVIRERSEYTLSADTAVLDLRPEFCIRRNSVQWANRQFRVRVFRERVPRNTEVMVLDRNGTFKHGIVRREPFTDTTLEGSEMGNLYSVLGIGTDAEQNSSAITRAGDSGALVLSVPQERNDDSEDDVLDVYGVVIGQIYFSAENSLTLANYLGGVIPEVFSDQAIVHRVGGIPTDDIDFTQMADHDPNAQ